MIEEALKKLKEMDAKYIRLIKVHIELLHTHGMLLAELKEKDERTKKYK